MYSVLLSTTLYSQEADSIPVLNKKRLRTFVAATTVTYGITLVGLNELWYKNAPRQSFHFFDDNTEWKQVDKMGHFFSSYYISFGSSKAFSWCGVAEKKSALLGSLTGFLVMLPIEIFDGFSTAYGASAGDLLANTAGASFFLGQSLIWQEQRIKPKFSFHQTHYAPIRPNVLGNDLAHELLKDYNGQTYWLSFDMDKFITFPKWINLAVGYGANGMVYARDPQNTQAGFQAYRQYYLSLDFDLKSIHTKSKALQTIISILDMIKLPSPTVEFSTRGTRFRPFYF